VFSTPETLLKMFSAFVSETFTSLVFSVDTCSPTIEELTEIKKREENNTQIKNEKDDETTEGKVIAGQNEDENKERKVDEKRDFLGFRICFFFLRFYYIYICNFFYSFSLYFIPSICSFYFFFIHCKFFRFKFSPCVSER
jgi:hypothetical protein